MIDLPPPDPGIEISLASQGISKGLRQTDGPQLLARGEIVFGPLFVASYLKNVSGPASDGETAAIIGLRGPAGGFDLVGSAAWKFGVAPVGFDDQALEINVAASRHIGIVTPRLSLTWSPDELGTTRRSLYTEAGATIAVAPHATVSAAVARRDRDGAPDYTAFNIGASYTFAEHFTVDVHWYDTDRSRLGEIYENRAVASIRARF